MHTPATLRGFERKLRGMILVRWDQNKAAEVDNLVPFYEHEYSELEGLSISELT